MGELGITTMRPITGSAGLGEQNAHAGTAAIAESLEEAEYPRSRSLRDFRPRNISCHDMNLLERPEDVSSPSITVIV
jgi:hypothetical protein